MAEKFDDDELFRHAMTDVKRLRSDVASDSAPKPRPEARFTEADREQVLVESLEGFDPSVAETGEELSYRRDGVAPAALRRLRRGRYSIEGELDLHGQTVPQARDAVTEFIRACLAGGKRCVRIVHGKGLGSGQRGPVLKGKLDVWLRRREDVLAFGSAPPVDGGTGAVYVLLRRSRKR